MKSKSFACVGFALALASAVVAGCSGPSNERGTVEIMTWWTEPGEKDGDCEHDRHLDTRPSATAT